MEDALREDARLRASEDAWIVGRFVVHASRVGELGGAPLPLAVVLDADLPPDPRVEAVESRPGADAAALAGAAREVYVEVPFDGTTERALEHVGALGLRAKLRCGGAATPPVDVLAAAVATCRRIGLPFKATAGLHHAFPAGGEHGFLTLLAAAVFGDEEQTLAAAPDELSLGREALVWRDRRADAAELARVRRDLFAGFGSCSVAEPVAELRALGVLPA